MAYVGMAHVVMAYLNMAYVVMAYVVMAYVVMAPTIAPTYSIPAIVGTCTQVGWAINQAARLITPTPFFVAAVRYITFNPGSDVEAGLIDGLT